VVDFDDPRIFNGGQDRGIRPLPAEVNVGGRVYYLALNNTADDAFVFLFKNLGRDRGLQPESTYLLSFTIDITGDAFAAAIGGGGSPATRIYLKARGNTVEPRLQPSSDDFEFVSRLNLDIGGQSQDGASVSVAENIANDINSLTSRPGGPEEFRFRLFRREHTHPVALRTDPSGRLFILVGTDSGFEGITRLY